MTIPKYDYDLDELRADLKGSFLLFKQSFFPQVTGRPYFVSSPIGREAVQITSSKLLTKIFRLEILNTVYAVPPGTGKSTEMAMWVAWTMAWYPISQYLYISFGFELAAKHTAFVKRIIELPSYRAIFDIKIRQDSRAKDFFQVEQGGSVKAFGATGPVVGQDGGLPNLDHFSGAVIMDDLHKPDEVHSDTVRERVIRNYIETIAQRPRGPNVPMIYIGQRLHEEDLPAFLLSGKDERKWTPLVLKAIDDAGNALYPEVNPLAQLREKQEKSPYVFASQYQQDPIPAGGALFKEKNFVILDEEPDMLLTFITADTAETSKSYNDASAFSFWGLYKIREMGLETGQVGLHWLDCWELRVEPKDLRSEFMSFYGDCMLHTIKPLIAAIEQKSTGVTLCSILKDMRGLRIVEVKRTKVSGSKTERYLEMQPIIASKMISFTGGAKHKDMCVSHLMKITANNSHRWDDICDTLYDAIKLTLIDKTLVPDQMRSSSSIVKSMAKDFNIKLDARIKSHAGSRSQNTFR